jgi:hypothetical protein
MSAIPVKVKRDHIEALVATKKPIVSLAELIWNGFDADASKVAVRFEYNGLGAIDSIRVTDNGLGINYDDAEELFGNLGGSWKGEKRKTPGGRNLHGKSGKGRFRAFALGPLVQWKSRFRRNGELIDFVLKGSSSNLESFDLSSARTISSGETGTEVVISDIQKNFTSLTDDDAPHEIAKFFAVYLAEYPGLTIDYAGVIVDPRIVQRHLANYSLNEILIPDGRLIPANLTIIEWNDDQERGLHLCDATGISLHVVPPGIQAPGFSFTAYLKSDHLRELDKEGRLILEDLDPDVDALISAAKSRMKGHFRKRAAESTAALVKEWKEQKVYPYEGEPAGPLESAERQVFDVLAVNLNAYLDEFDQAPDVSKRFTFTLVKQALKENPESLQRIFEDVLKLPRELQDDLAGLLNKTSLAAIITSAKLVGDRLNFLRGLEILLFDKESRAQLLERDQLHKILEKETWIFGESFHLTNCEETLNEVLEKYLERLGERSDAKGAEKMVEREYGKGGRIDLMLARSVPHPRADEHEHLVVELKRPSKIIDTGVLTQIQSYALAVAQDERFKNTKTRWTFLAISNDMTTDAVRSVRQRGRPEGLWFDDHELNITVWARTWSQLINAAKARMDFFKKHLDFEADRESATDYLRKAHEKYLPTVIRDDGPAADAADTPLPESPAKKVKKKTK